MPNDDPIRDEVERRLRSMVELALAGPRAAKRAVDGCLQERVDSVLQLVGTPLALLRSLFDLVAAPAEPTVPTEVIDTDVAEPAPVEVRPDAGGAADELPIEEYESLAASQVVARLEGLDPDELRRVRRFEAAHRSRRTVLGKVDQLLE